MYKLLVVDEEEKILENFKDVIVGVRNVRANMNIHPTKKADLIFVTKEYREEIKQFKTYDSCNAWN